ncbi:MAG: alcohol dehydrogenase catalytic domain-containing protein [Phycisphaerales bacterium]|nr:alcohol dehydrogenase catalytic domain-containing protein [Phycisphaerales bacterium]
MKNNAESNKMLALVYRNSFPRWMLCKAAGWITPTIFSSPLSGLHLASVPIPPLPGPRWVRLKTILGGICGTDMAAIMQKHHPAFITQVFASRPAIVGHENVALIDEVGPDVTRWQKGRRVVVEPSLSCTPRGIEPQCPHCAAGRFTLCDNFLTGPLPAGCMIGWNCFTGGSWAPYFIAHESQLYQVPDSLNDEQAVLIDPIAGALHAVLRRRPADNETVLILGAGPLGLGVAACIRALGGRCRLLALDRASGNLELISRYGVDATICVGAKANQAERYGQFAGHVGGTVIPVRFGHQVLIGGCDLVYDCIGTGQSLTDAMKYARAGGTVVEVGTSQISLVDTAPLWFDELNLIGANGRAIEQYEGRTMHTYEIVLELIQQKKLDLTDLLTHRFRIEQYREALAALYHRGRSGAIKVAFDHR